MNHTKPVVITLGALERDSIHKVQGPLNIRSVSGSICKLGALREMWALHNATMALPWQRLARHIFGPEFATKKLPIIVRTANPEVIRLCMDAASWDEPQGEHGFLLSIHQRYKIAFELLKSNDEELTELVQLWKAISRP